VVSQPTTLTLIWNPSSGSATYRLQISTSSAFASAIVDDSTITTTSRQVGPLANNTTYYWRVYAKNAGGTGPWSTVWNFTTVAAAPPAPTLAQPSNAAVNQPTTSTLSWDPSTDATTYRLQISRSSGFTTAVVDDSTITSTSRQVGPLENNTTYYWRVNAKNAGGTSAWSNVWSFTTIVQLPRQVLLISPLNSEVIGADSVRFTWRQSGPAVSRYWFELSTDSVMTNPVIDSTLMATDTTKIVRQLLDKQTYWWRVRVKNIAGWGPISDQRRFGIDIPTGIYGYDDVPREFNLNQNYPNPFNPETTIKYQLPWPAEVRLEIYNILGEKVKTLVDEKQPAGYYSASWNGLDEHGRTVAGGVYLYHFTAGEFVQVRKLILVR